MYTSPILKYGTKLDDVGHAGSVPLTGSEVMVSAPGLPGATQTEEFDGLRVIVAPHSSEVEPIGDTE